MYDNETSVLVRLIVVNLINRISSGLPIHIDAMKPIALKAVVKTDNVELIKHCFHGEAGANILQSEYYVSFVNIALANNNCESLVYLMNVPITTRMTALSRGLLNRDVFKFYFSGSTARSPVSCLTFEQHIQVIDKLLLIGAPLDNKKSFAMEYLFKSQITGSWKPQLSELFLERGATLDDCNPKKIGHSLLTIAIAKRDECSVEYLLKRAKMEQGYEAKYMSATQYAKSVQMCVGAWCREKKTFRNRDILFHMIKHAASVEDKTIERIVTSPKIVEGDIFLTYLLEHHRQAMMSYEKWDWTHARKGIGKHTLRKYYGDEFAATIMLGTNLRLNQKSMLRHLSEDPFVMIFHALFH